MKQWPTREENLGEENKGVECTILGFKRNEYTSFQVHIKLSPVLTSLWLHKLFLIIVSSKQEIIFIRMSQIFIKASEPSSKFGLQGFR